MPGEPSKSKFTGTKGLGKNQYNESLVTRVSRTGYSKCRPLMFNRIQIPVLVSDSTLVEEGFVGLKRVTLQSN
jgi:hypothetical protein